jgi:hypothetical protein
VDLDGFGDIWGIPRFLDNFTLVLQLNIPKKELGSHKSGNPKTNLFFWTNEMDAHHQHIDAIGHIWCVVLCFFLG